MAFNIRGQNDGTRIGFNIPTSSNAKAGRIRIRRAPPPQPPSTPRGGGMMSRRIEEIDDDDDDDAYARSERLAALTTAARLRRSKAASGNRPIHPRTATTTTRVIDACACE